MTTKKTLNIWTEKYRPQTVKDVVLPKQYRDFFENIVKTGICPHLILYGRAGLGKTSVAKALAKDLKADVLYINASLNNSIDDIRTDVVSFASTNSFFNSKKIVILDEADRLTAGQEALKVLLEERSETTFIFITNDIFKIIKPLQSRCTLINFEVTKENRKTVAIEYFKRLIHILKSENIDFSEKVVANIVERYFPDLRKMIGTAQYIVQSTGSLKTLSSLETTSNIDNLIEAIKQRNFNSIRSLCSNIDPVFFYRTVFRKLDNLVSNNDKPAVVQILSEYSFQHNLTADPEINFVSCCVELMTGVTKWLEN